MSCKICGRSACASWMHSAEDQLALESVENMSESEMINEILDLRKEVQNYKDELRVALERSED